MEKFQDWPYSDTAVSGAQLAAAQERAAARSTAQQRHRAHVDEVGHDSVQPWSAGPLFPCVIAVRERYPAEREYTLICEYTVQTMTATIRATSEREACAILRHRNGYTGLQRVYAVREEPGRPSVSYVLHAYGREEEYATREDAEQVARALNRYPNVRDAWRRRLGINLHRVVVGDFHGQPVYSDEVQS